MARQTNDANIVGEILAAKLCAEADVVRFAEQFLLQFYIAESAAGLVAGCRESVIIMRRSQFHRQEVALCRRTANDKGDMVRRASGRT